MEFINEYAAMMPLLILAVGVLITLLVSLIRVEWAQPSRWSALLTLGLAGVSALQSPAPGRIEGIFAGALSITPGTQFFTAILVGIAALILFASKKYLEREQLHLSDFYALALILVLGSVVFIAAQDLLVMFVALETFSLPAYTLSAFRRNDPRSNEAGIKYFIMGGVAGAVFLLGASFLFGAYGTLDISAIRQMATDPQPLALMGILLLMAGLFFKIAAVPFHFWKPDVYEGAPVVAGGLMATVVTLASTLALIKVIHVVDWSAQSYAGIVSPVSTAVMGFGVLTAWVGTLISVVQTQLKRFFAYSSIANSGYVLVGIGASLVQPAILHSISFYIVGYSVVTAMVFVLLAQTRTVGDQGLEFVDLTGLIKRSGLLTVFWSLGLFALAGIPLTSGFTTKFYLFLGLAGAKAMLPLVLLLPCVVVGAYAYLRPFGLMVMRDADPDAKAFSFDRNSLLVVGILAAVVLVVGVYPDPLLVVLKEAKLFP